MQDRISQITPDYIMDFINSKSFMTFIYRGTIIMTGYVLLLFISEDGFTFTKTILSMSVWLILIILLNPPEQAQSDEKPFTKPLFEEDDMVAKTDASDHQDTEKDMTTS